MADMTVDSLQIEIKASATQAENAINRLVDSLNTLKKATKDYANFGTDKKGLKSFSSDVTGLAKAFNKVDVKKINSFTRALKTIQTLGQVKVSDKHTAELEKTVGQVKQVAKASEEISKTKTVDLGANLKAIAEGMRDIGSVKLPKGQVEGIAQFASAMARFGSKNAVNASENIPKLADAFQELATRMDSIEVSDKTVQFASAMAEIAKNAARVAPNVTNVSSRMTAFRSAISTATGAVKKFVSGALNVLKKTLQGLGTLFTKAAKGAASLAKSFLSAVAAFVKSHTALGKLSSALGKFRLNADNADKSAKNFALTVGLLYARFFLVVRAIKKLWGSIKSSMDYIETLNYFNAAFKQVSDTAVGDWKKLGYDSAEAYADSFASRAKQLTSKFTGFDILDSGELKASGGKSLGLNPTSLMNYQAQFAQMASSMGASANNATLLSQALIEIGADLASVKNLGFEEVWNDMASGMVGMSRTLDKYGVNIRVAALNQKLLDLGIEATVDDLSGADKAMLRTIVLLDSTKYAWGDLAETINAPSNQLRLLTANLENCARMLGNIFLPLVAKILPYLNAMTIALQRFLSAVASFFGVDLASITSSVGGSNEAISDLLDEADGLSDGLDDAAQSAKKLKNNLLGVDELNVITDNVTSTDTNGSMSSLLDDAFLDSLSEYQAAWDKAFDEMANKANDLADKIVSFFKKLFKPLTDAWDNKGSAVIDAWKDGLGEVGKLLKSIGSDFMTVLQEAATTQIFENWLDVLADIGKVVGNLAHNFREAWEENNRGYNILANIRDIFLGISKVAKEVADYAVEWSKNLNFAPLLESIMNLTRAIADNAENIFGIVGDIYKRVMDFGKYLIEVFIPSALQIIADFVNKVDWGKLREELNRIWTALEKIAEVIGDWLLGAFEKLADVIARILNSGYITRLADDFTKLADSLKNARSLGEVINAIFDFTDSRVADAVQIFNSAVRAIDDFLTYLNTVDPNTGKKPLEQIAERIAGVLNTAISNWDAAGTGKLVSDAAISLLRFFRRVIENVNWYELGQKIGEMLSEMDWKTILEEAGKLIADVLSGLLETWLGIKAESPIAAGLLVAVGGLKLLGVGLTIAGKIAEALTGHSAMQLIGDALKKLLGGDKAIQAAGEAGETVAKTGFLSKALTYLNTPLTEIAGTYGGLGVIGAVGATAVAAVEGFKTGNRGAKAIDDDSNAWAYDEAYNAMYNFEDFKKSIKDQWEAVIAIFKGNSDESKHLQWKMEKETESYNKLVKAYGKSKADQMYKDAHSGMSYDQVIEDLQKQAEEAGGHWYNIGWNIIKGIGAGFVAAFSTITTSIGLLFHVIWEGIKSRFGISSPAKEMYPLGEYILLGIVEGFKGAFGAFWSAITEFFGKITGWFADKWGEIKQSFSDGWQAIKDTVAEKWEGIKEHFTDFKDTVTEWKDNTVQAFTEWKDNVGATLSEWKDNFVAWKDGIIGQFVEWKDNAIAAFSEWKDKAVSAFDEWKKSAVNSVSAWYKKTKAEIEDWAKKIKDRFSDWKDNVINTFSEWKTNVETTVSEWVTNVTTAVENWKTDIQQRFENWRTTVHNTIVQWKSDVEKRFGEWVTNVTSTIQSWKSDIEGRFEDWRNKVHDTIKGWKEDVEKRFSEWSNAVKLTIEDWKNDLINRFNSWASEVIGTISNWASNTWNTISSWVSDTWNNLTWWVDDLKWKFEEWRQDVGGKIWQWAHNALDDIWNFVSNASSWLSGLVENAKNWFSEQNWTFSGVWNGLTTTFKNAVNFVRPFVNQLISMAYGAVNAVKELMGVSGSRSVSYNGKKMDFINGTQWFASGGFPEDGFFFANHNELVGRFSNGKTAVANNEQITDGIENAVYRAMSNVMGESSRETQLLEELLNAVRAGKNIIIDGREIVTTYDSRSARNGWSFT